MRNGAFVVHTPILNMVLIRLIHMQSILWHKKLIFWLQTLRDKAFVAQGFRGKHFIVHLFRTKKTLLPVFWITLRDEDINFIMQTFLHDTDVRRTNQQCSCATNVWLRCINTTCTTNCSLLSKNMSRKWFFLIVGVYFTLCWNELLWTRQNLNNIFKQPGSNFVVEF